MQKSQQTVTPASYALVRAKLRTVQSGFSVSHIDQYSTVFCRHIVVLPIADPDEVIRILTNQLALVAVVGAWEWVVDDIGDIAYMRVDLTDYARQQFS